MQRTTRPNRPDIQEAADRHPGCHSTRRHSARQDPITWTTYPDVTCKNSTRQYPTDGGCLVIQRASGRPNGTKPMGIRNRLRSGQGRSGRAPGDGGQMCQRHLKVDHLAAGENGPPWSSWFLGGRVGCGTGWVAARRPRPARWAAAGMGDDGRQTRRSGLIMGFDTHMIAGEHRDLHEPGAAHEASKLSCEDHTCQHAIDGRLSRSVC
jgi:hypothetical protein